MTRLYGRIEGGARILLPKPYLRGRNHSILGAVSRNEVVAALYSEGSTI